MKNNLLKIVALITMSVFLISNISVFALESTNGGYQNSLNNNESQNKEYIRVGEITQIHSNNIVIGQKSGKVTFMITDKTAVINQRGSNIKLSELKVGMEVEVTYNKTSGNNKDRVYDAKCVQMSEDIYEISDAVIEEISLNNDGTLLLTIYFETLDSKNKVVGNLMYLVVDNNTKITDQFGAKALKDKIQTGMVIDVDHSNVLTKGTILQSYANEIDIVKKTVKSDIIESKIIDKYIFNNIVYVLVGNPNKVNEQLNLVLSNETLLKDQKGKNITYNMLEIGQKIRAEHSLALTRSLPAQTQAYSIQVIEQKTVPSIEKATIEEIDVKNSNITVNYDVKNNNKLYKETIILLIDKDTIINDVLENVVALKDLKVGMIVNVKHSEAVTLSLPATAKAYEITVIDDKQTVLLENAKVEKIDTKNNSVTVTYEEKYNNKVYEETIVLLIDNNTVIKDASKKTIALNDLKAGMLIDATHSEAVTFSNPAKTLAYTINVLSTTNPPANDELKDLHELLEKLFKELGVDNWLEIISDKNIDWDFDDEDDLEDKIEEIVEKVLGDDYDDDDDMEDKVEDLIEKLIKEMKISDKNFKSNKRKDD